jgi:DNA repair exonuclease SbcCD ATPase subunit
MEDSVELDVDSVLADKFDIELNSEVLFNGTVIEEHMQRLEKENEELIVSRKVKNSSINDKTTLRIEGIAKLRQDNLNEINELQEKHKKVMSQLEEEHERVLQLEEEDLQKEKAMLEHQHKMNIENIENQHKLNISLQKKILKLSNNNQSYIESINQVHSMKLKLKEEMREKTDELDKKKKES